MIGAGFLKNLIGGKGSEIIESVGGVIDEFTQSKEEKAQLKLETEKVLNQHLQALEAEATKQFEIQMKDMADSRNREIQIATSDKAPTLNKVITPILALVVIALVFLLFYLIMFKPNIGVEKDILVFVLGALISQAGQVLSYYFGSSRGSTDKQAQIDRMINK